MLELAALAFAAKPLQEILVPSPPTTVHPLYAWTADDHRLHERLHRRIDEVLAELGVDGTSVHIAVARGPRWWDGEPLVAADVCATIVRARAEDRPTPYTAATRARIAACAVDPEDPLRAVVTLTAPLPDPRVALAVPLVPAHRPDFASSGPDTAGAAALGSGPWRAAREADEWLLNGPIGKVRWTVDPDPLAAFVAGRGLEVVVPAARLGEVRALGTIDLRVGEPVIWALLVNTTRGPLQDERVRQALDLAIDRDRLGAAVLGVEGPTMPRPWSPVSGPFAPGTPGWSGGVPVPLPRPDRAKALLAAAGVPADWTLTVAVPTGRAPPGFVEALGRELAGIGLAEVALDPTQWWFSLEAGGHAEVTDLALVPMRPGDPGPWLHTRTPTAGWSNPFGWSDPATDALLERLECGDAEAGQHLHGRLADLRPALFLWIVAERIASRAPVR